MDELEISGKRYISTRRAAREHGYHSDYMGQLIRSKKVAGQKVGRAWYIEEESLNAYLGKEPAAPATSEATPATVANVASAPQSAPVERLIIEEPAPPAPAPQPVVEIVAPIPPTSVPAEIVEQESQPIAVRIEPKSIEPAHAHPSMQEIHHAPLYTEQETRVPVHTPPIASRPIAGLRYAADESPLIPMVTRMPQPYMQAQAHTTYAPAKHSTGKFPYISLTVVGVIALIGAAFVSNFVSATVVSQPGQPATVHYAIHW